MLQSMWLQPNYVEKERERERKRERERERSFYLVVDSIRAFFLLFTKILIVFPL